MSGAGPSQAANCAPLGGSEAASAASVGANPFIDVVLPVFNAPDDVARCVESVLASTAGDYRLVLIDDGSTDPRIAHVFDAIARRGDPHVTLLRNPRNVGFTATVNRGMSGTRADVVLLNSDAVVTAGWLEALARCARSDPRIATVTPFSNNAEICSFPSFCEDNRWPDAADPAPIRDALAAAAVPTYPDLPTGVGFCLYIRREALDELGMFDLAFGAGYGEENDFCLRAARAGWRNVLADDAFVLHRGGKSFAGRKDTLGAANMEILLDRYPHYAAMVRDYVERDPLRPLRDAAQSRLAAMLPQRGVLHIVHSAGGGTMTHVRTLIGSTQQEWRHYIAIAAGGCWQVQECAPDGGVRRFEFERQPDESWREFVGGIVATFAISIVHIHHLSTADEDALAGIDALAIPYGITVHDLWLACPTVTLIAHDGRFCGGVTDVAACTRCLDAQPSFAGTDVGDWRRRHALLIERAAFVIAPSEWVAQTLIRYFPDANVTIVPHASPAATRRAQREAGAGPLTAIVLPDDDVPVVAFVGAIGIDKGARRIERMVDLARERDDNVRFVVIGYLDVQHDAWQSEDARLTVHGHYRGHDLPALFAHYRPRLVAYPSNGPESFSYTLSETWDAGLPALVPPIGALAERVAESGAGWVMTHDEWVDDKAMLDRICELAAGGASALRADAARRARAVDAFPRRAMADATLALYTAALVGNAKRAAQSLSPFATTRVRDALGYRPWHPPAIEAPETGSAVASRSTAAKGWSQRIAQRALEIRQTPMGRFLYRVAPASLIDALRARLDG